MKNASYTGNSQDTLGNPWKGLSIKDKSDIIRIAIDNGITDLHSIRQEYNKFAEGDNLYKEGGHVYDELPQLLKDAGLDIKVTSGYRKARYAGDKSWHIHHGAVDIIPQGKTTFEDIENAVYSNPGIYNYMLSNGLGILDETGRTKSSRDTMKKTRATGAHFHFGKDSVPARAFADRMSSLWDNRMEGLRQSVETPLAGLQVVPDFIPSNPQIFFNPYSYQAPAVLEPVQPSTSVEDRYSQEALDRQERAEGLKRLGMVMNILNPSGDNSIVNTLAMLSGNQFKGGGSIHIKPENRGKFTALKKRTGHSATWFKEHGTPAQKKMAVFALNARKWKHGLGGNLFSGKEEGSQQMDNGLNLFRNTNREGDVYYTYQNSPDGEEVRLTPLATIGNDPAYWTWTDDTGKVYTPRITRHTESTVEKDARNALSRAIGNYFGELRYQADNNIPISGKYTMPAIAMGALLPAIGEAVAGSSIAGVPVTTWADAALTSAFGAHGINHAVNEGINGLGDAAMTALEIAPLGKLAKPVWNAGKGTIAEIQALYNNYPIRNYNIDALLKSDFYNKISEQYGKEFADDLAQKLTSKEFRNYLFGDNPRRAFKDADRHLRQMQFIEDVENAGGLLGGSGQLAKAGTVNREGLMHDIDFFIPGSMTDKTSPVFDALGYTTYADPATNNTTLFGTGFRRPVKPQIIMGSPEKGYINMPKERYGMTADMFIREQMPSNEEVSNVILSAKRQFGRPKDLTDIEAFKPYSSTNPIIDISTGQGQWNPTLFDKGIFTKEKYPFVQSVETYPGSRVIVPAVMNYKGQIKALSSPTVSRTPQITAENAASITPAQWTAAQDAAIARGDMAEAQRLRDLHFKVSAPNTKTDMPLWTSSEELFNSFDLRHFGKTDSGFFGYGHYMTPIEDYAASYHPVNRKFYVNVQNPYIGDNDAYFNRMNYVKDRLARRKEGVLRDLNKGRVQGIGKRLGITENTSLEEANRILDRYVADETVKWNNKYVKYADEFEGKDGVLSWRDIQGVPNKREGIYKEVVVPRGEQIKSADAITYNDKGVRIPLGERDNFNINDIRYAIAPILAGGVGYGAYKK